MQWNELKEPWQRVFELSWDSFCEGNIPIAAVITDQAGNILSTGRNHYITNSRFPNRRTDHAETECIQQLDIKKYPEVKEYILYTSMEPCPMCMGTIVMANIRDVRIAARDGWAGATDICDTNRYIYNKHTKIQFMKEAYGIFQIIFQSYFELKSIGESNPVLKQFEQDYPAAVAAARILYKDRVLDHFAEQKAGYEMVFQKVCRTIEDMKADT